MSTDAIDEVVVDRMVSRFGLHGVHVLRAGGKVDAEAWLRSVPEDATQVWSVAYEEKELGISHLLVYWKEKGAECYDGWIRE